MWVAIKYHRAFSADSCNVLQSVATDHKALGLAHWLCDSFADHIAPSELRHAFLHG